MYKDLLQYYQALCQLAVSGSVTGIFGKSR